jgi:deazaflavin-dependent oxidoreductase (nitroreductase family)
MVLMSEMTNDDMNNWNAQIIAEFRTTGGKVASFGDAPIVILNSIGAKSGKTRENPLVALVDGDRFVIYASKAGAPDNPDWYYNLKANPRAELEYGTERFAVEAVEITRAERDELYARQVAANPGFGDYEKATTRVIPVVALSRV